MVVGFLTGRPPWKKTKRAYEFELDNAASNVQNYVRHQLQLLSTFWKPALEIYLNLWGVAVHGLRSSPLERVTRIQIRAWPFQHNLIICWPSAIWNHCEESSGNDRFTAYWSQLKNLPYGREGEWAAVCHLITHRKLSLNPTCTYIDLFSSKHLVVYNSRHYIDRCAVATNASSAARSLKWNHVDHG